jgi:hypothetical protein
MLASRSVGTQKYFSGGSEYFKETSVQVIGVPEIVEWHIAGMSCDTRPLFFGVRRVTGGLSSVARPQSDKRSQAGADRRRGFAEKF